MSTHVIWSNEHCAWWRPGKMGYASDIREAGVYSLDEAREIVEKATIVHVWAKGGPNELAVRIDDLPLTARMLVGKRGANT